jgi:transposase
MEAPTGREEKEKLVIELYYTKGHTYKQITKELRMSPNQIRDIIKKHEEKSNAIANKTKQLSLSSKAYKLYSKGKTGVEVAIKLDIPQAHATQFHLEYWKLKRLDVLESLYVRTRGKLFSLCKLYEELVVKRGMSIEQIDNIVDIALHKLPYIEGLFEIAKREADRMQEKIDYVLEGKISLKNELIELEVEKRRKELALSSNHYPYYGGRENSATEAYFYFSNPRPLPLVSLLLEPYDQSTQYRNDQEEIHGVDKGDIAD